MNRLGSFMFRLTAIAPILLCAGTVLLYGSSWHITGAVVYLCGCLFLYLYKYMVESSKSMIKSVKIEEAEITNISKREAKLYNTFSLYFISMCCLYSSPVSVLEIAAVLSLITVLYNVNLNNEIFGYYFYTIFVQRKESYHVHFLLSRRLVKLNQPITVVHMDSETLVRK